MSLTIPDQREILAQDVKHIRIVSPEEQMRDILRRLIVLMQKQNTYTMQVLGTKMQILPEWVAEANEELHKLRKELDI